MFNFGKPDILRIILVLFFKKSVKKIGSTVIRWIIKKFGSLLIIKFFNLIKFRKKINRYDNLLFIKPPFGR